VVYRESPLPHAIDPRFVAALSGWVDRALRRPGGSAPERRQEPAPASTPEPGAS
jgi:hypothetical protein